MNTQQVAQELADVVEDHATLAYGGHDGGEVVVRQNHLGALLGHFGAGDAHGHADVRGLDCRGIVHTVAGHGSINGIWVLSCVILPTHFKCVIEGIFPIHSAKGIALTNPKIIDISLFRGMRRVIFLIFDI